MRQMITACAAATTMLMMTAAPAQPGLSSGLVKFFQYARRQSRQRSDAGQDVELNAKTALANALISDVLDVIPQ